MTISPLTIREARREPTMKFLAPSWKPSAHRVFSRLSGSMGGARAVQTVLGSLGLYEHLRVFGERQPPGGSFYERAVRLDSSRVTLADDTRAQVYELTCRDFSAAVEIEHLRGGLDVNGTRRTARLVVLVLQIARDEWLRPRPPEE